VAGVAVGVESVGWEGGASSPAEELVHLLVEAAQVPSGEGGRGPLLQGDLILRHTVDLVGDLDLCVEDLRGEIPGSGGAEMDSPEGYRVPAGWSVVVRTLLGPEADVLDLPAFLTFLLAKFVQLGVQLLSDLVRVAPIVRNGRDDQKCSVGGLQCGLDDDVVPLLDVLHLLLVASFTKVIRPDAQNVAARDAVVLLDQVSDATRPLPADQLSSVQPGLGEIQRPTVANGVFFHLDGDVLVGARNPVLWLEMGISQPLLVDQAAVDRHL